MLVNAYSNNILCILDYTNAYIEQKTSKHPHHIHLQPPIPPIYSITHSDPCSTTHRPYTCTHVSFTTELRCPWSIRFTNLTPVQSPEHVYSEVCLCTSPPIAFINATQGTTCSTSAQPKKSISIFANILWYVCLTSCTKTSSCNCKGISNFDLLLFSSKEDEKSAADGNRAGHKKATVS